MKTTEEQDELRGTVRGLLSRLEGEAAWRPLAEQIGVAALAVPEEYGGVGGSAMDLLLVAEELGRVLSPVPFLGSSVLATYALLESGDEAACAELLPGFAEGSALGALAWAEADGSWDPAAVRATAVRDADGWAVTGVKEHVLSSGEVLLVAARTAAGVSLFRIRPEARSARVTPVPAMDDSRPLYRVVLDSAPARLVGEDGDGERVLGRVLDRGCAALAAEQVGAASYALQATVEYAKTRVQFGRPIGSFQAVKHRLADLYVAVESARSLALAAAVSPGDRILAAAAKSACSEMFSLVAGEMIQLHGGIGLTWEHMAHRYFKRAHATAQLLGPARWHRSRIPLAA